VHFIEQNYPRVPILLRKPDLLLAKQNSKGIGVKKLVGMGFPHGHPSPQDVDGAKQLQQHEETCKTDYANKKIEKISVVKFDERNSLHHKKAGEKNNCKGKKRSPMSYRINNQKDASRNHESNFFPSDPPKKKSIQIDRKQKGNEVHGFIIATGDSAYYLVIYKVKFVKLHFAGILQVAIVQR
jgi:hypothetical protein